MTTFLSLLAAWWWVLPVIAAIVLYKWVFRLFGIWIIPEDKVGIVTRKNFTTKCIFWP
jgi:hypothetical protein